MVSSPSNERMGVDLEQFDHPAWLSVVGVGLGYAIILAVMTVALFVVPWLVFSVL